jgi:hypothetical protein
MVEYPSAKRVLARGIAMAISVVLVGCATPVDTRPKLDLNNPNANHASKLFAAERNHLGDKRPKIGLALSGGGTKAAVFAHGVLHGLNDAHVLEHVDVISSVSGGSYAAMWYFTKQMEAKKHGFDVSDIFKDCWGSWRLNEETDIKKDDFKLYKSIFDVAKDSADESCGNPTHWVDGDPYRFQNHLIRYPDLFRTEYTKITGNRQTAPVRESLGLLAQVTAELFVGWAGIDTGLVDAYQAGIERTWGLNPNKRSATYASKETKDAWTYTNSTTQEGARYLPRMAASSATFTQLRDLYKDEKSPPIWVLQATIGNKGNLPNMDTMYEISPFIQGSSREDARWTSNPDEFQMEIEQIPTAVRASAAFADSQGVQPGILKSLMVGITNHLLPSSRWGVKVKLRNGDDARLSDGGGADNLGLMSLVRRQLDDIIIADSAQDRSGTMDDLCWAKRALKQEGVELTMDHLKDFDSICEYTFDKTDSSKHLAYNVSMWFNPVVTGKITYTGTGKVTRLWLIKPGWNQQAIRKAYNGPKAQCGPKPLIPCGLLLYYANNADGEYLDFPQDGTVSAVLNFSSYKTIAYRELGRFNAGFLKFDNGTLSVTKELRDQPSYPAKKGQPGPDLCEYRFDEYCEKPHVDGQAAQVLQER